MAYINGFILLSDNRRHGAHLTCARSGACVCGFCKATGQCEWGDCLNPLPTTGVVGTLCLRCSTYAGRVALPGHRASIVAAERRTHTDHVPRMRHGAGQGR